jgi:hypothetical protein
MNLRAKFYPNITSIFRKIQKEFPDALLAGGAVRDLVLNRPIKDGDIFIGGNPNKSIFHKKIFDKTHWIQNPTRFWRDLLEDETWRVYVQTGTYSKLDDISIDLVVKLFNPYLASISNFDSFDIVFLLKSAKSYFIEDFDFNICKAAYDGSNYLYTYGFLKDISNKTITLSGPLDKNKINYSMNVHLPRIKHKYSTYQTVVPLDYLKILRGY